VRRPRLHSAEWNLQSLGDLRLCEVLAVLEHEHLAVSFGELVERLADGEPQDQVLVGLVPGDVGQGGLHQLEPPVAPAASGRTSTSTARRRPARTSREVMRFLLSCRCMTAWLSQRHTAPVQPARISYNHARQR
jgi:hypothetical protein